MTNKLGDSRFPDSTGEPQVPDAPGVDATFVTRHSSFRIPHVACFTPLSPVASGISYYSEELLPVLARALRVDVFVDGYEPTEAASLRAAGIALRDGRSFERA